MSEREFFPLVGSASCDICRGRLKPGALVVKAPGPIFPRLYYCKRCITKEDQ